MKRILMMISAVAALATPAWGAAVGSCCACLADFTAQTSGPPPPADEALFCRLVSSESQQDAFSADCLARQGASICTAMAQSASAPGTLNCTALLAEGGIACPAAKTVPAAGHWWLAGLIAALLATGAWFARRRPRPAAATFA